jgi:hypothetical protein
LPTLAGARNIFHSSKPDGQTFNGQSIGSFRGSLFAVQFQPLFGGYVTNSSGRVN